MNQPKHFIQLALIVSFNSILIFACSHKSDETQQKLQSLADSLVNYYQTEKGITDGGFYIGVVTPENDYIVTSGLPEDVTDKSHYRIASISKTFTAAAIMLLHQEGKLNIFDTITSIIPRTEIGYVPDDSNYNVPFKDKITIEQLLQHRAGVFDVTNMQIPDILEQPYAGKMYVDYIRSLPGNDNHTFTFDELIGVVAKNGVYYSQPGDSFHYSNTGYNILGKIIERVSGITYTEFITKNFIEPLGLNNTYCVWEGSDTKIPMPFVYSNMYNDGEVINTTEGNMSPHVTEGSIISTPTDIMKWIQLLLTAQAGIDETHVAMMKNVLKADTGHKYYGLGLTYNEGLGFGHDGAHVSYLSTLRYDPSTGITVLVFANFFDLSDFFAEAYAVRDLALAAVNIVKQN